MLRLLASIALLSLATNASAAQDVLQDQILPGFQNLAAEGEMLAQTATENCDSTTLREEFSDTLGAWTGVSHYRFGPTEAENRGFALAFWPDTRGKTPKAIRGLILSKDPAINDPNQFADVSIAARGLFALEYLLYDTAIRSLGDEEYRCKLVQAIALDVARVTADLSREWQESYANELRNPGDGRLYQSEAEVAQEYYKALSTGLQITGDLRLGRPLGTFDRPRPKRAEAWRSGNSLMQVEIALVALRELALALAEGDAELYAKLESQFIATLAAAERLDDPSFAGVTEPGKRFRIEALQQDVNDLRALVSQELGPKLGVTAGFNSLDGD